jgi:hypothetical protein
MGVVERSRRWTVKRGALASLLVLPPLMLMLACEAPTVSGDMSADLPLPGRTDQVPITTQQAEAGGAPPVETQPIVLDGGSKILTAPCDGGCDAAVDASVTQTFTLGSSDCNGGHCNGGYDDSKDSRQMPTADKQCRDRGFARATDFSIGGQPGGRFCSYDYDHNSYGCDGSCSGCNTMKTVTCVKP